MPADIPPPRRRPRVAPGGQEGAQVKKVRKFDFRPYSMLAPDGYKCVDSPLNDQYEQGARAALAHAMKVLRRDPEGTESPDISAGLTVAYMRIDNILAGRA